MRVSGLNRRRETDDDPESADDNSHVPLRLIPSALTAKSTCGGPSVLPDGLLVDGG